jgi:pyrroline-5-carboxylate reductase
MTSALPPSLVLLGAGKMGGAMLEGWLSVGMDGPRITILDPHPSAEIVTISGAHHVRLNPPLARIPAPSVVVLAIKPQMLDSIVPILATIVTPDSLIVSILAGKTIADLKARLPACGGVIRAMPNLPASVGRGMTAAAASSSVSDRHLVMADSLLKAVGKVEWLPNESLIDAVTAVSGSGPAYVFHMVEALAAAGVSAGLPPDVAERLARATVEGAGELLYQLNMPPGKLRQNVTSPGGTTAAALEVLMADNGLTTLMRKAVAAAKTRAEELAG